MKLRYLPVLFLSLLLVGCSRNALPKPEVEDGLLGEMFGFDKNVNVSTIDKYLDRTDSVYRDMRMLIDPADYSALPGGDSYLSGFVRGFEAVPLPLIIPVNNDLPPEVGESYGGPTLFSKEGETYTPLYHESLAIIEYLFPKDKNIMLMCGGGGYAGMMRTLLIKLGWDINKIYNTGAFWSYEGVNRVDVKRVNANNEVVYDFYKVSYHDFDFTSLVSL